METVMTDDARVAARPSLELQALLDAAADAVIFIDHDGIIQVFNPAAERMFGYAEEDALGRNITLLLAEPDREHYRVHLERLRRSGTSDLVGTGREVQAQRRGGGMFPALLSIGQIQDAAQPRFVAFFHDITVRRQALEQLERARERAQCYLEAAQTMLVSIDTKRRVTMINRKCCEVLECDPTRLVGSDWFDRAIPAEHRGRVRFEFHALLEREPRRPHYFECPVTTGAGAERLIMWRAMAVENAQGEVAEVLWSGEDVTDTRRAETELRDIRQRIMQVSRLATAGEMASGIAHELNQPLAAIANFAQASTRLLSSPAPDLAEVQDALRQIAEQALRSGDIIHRFRSLTRYRALTLEQVNLNDVIKEIEPLTHADARASGTRVILELSSEPLPVRVDRIQMQQVLLNLLRNSFDAMQSIAPGQREITIRTTRDACGDLELIVADNGPGVPEEMHARLFMPFATTKEQGTGLGLVISRSIVEAHGGRLQYQSNQPHGARFTVTLGEDEQQRHTVAAGQPRLKQRQP
jgi:two-component system, LuxR family, sensor kinase FixL